MLYNAFSLYNTVKTIQYIAFSYIWYRSGESGEFVAIAVQGFEFVVQAFYQPKIEYFHVPPNVETNVLRLDVSVNEPQLVHVLKGLGQIVHDQQPGFQQFRRFVLDFSVVVVIGCMVIVVGDKAAATKAAAPPTTKKNSTRFLMLLVVAVAAGRCTLGSTRRPSCLRAFHTNDP